MNWKSVEDLKTQLMQTGRTKIVLGEKDMVQLIEQLNKDKRAIDTPREELRYIEGLFNLPPGFIESFKVIPKPGSEKCECGRVPTALDIVYSAFSKQIHPRELIRDTLIGITNVFEAAKDGRTGECLSCGRPVVMFSYWTNSYAYA